jgi:hypothetical protein
MGQRISVPEAIAISNGRPITGYKNVGSDEEKRSWVIRLTNWLGITMTRTDSPHGWSFNPATATLALVVAGGLLTGGYLWGENIAERRHLMERIQKAEDDSRRAAQLAAAAAGQAGHNANTEVKK